MTTVPDEVFYYVHHHGGGHRSRAKEILRHLEVDVTLLSSLPRPADLENWIPAGSTARRDWLTLPLDTGDGIHPGAAVDHPDPDAGGQLHWAPLHHRGLQARHRMLTAAIAERSPALLVSDVSVEIACVARLSGVPVVSVLLPGQRDDAPHRLAFGLSRGLLAPWPQPPTEPAWMRPWTSRTFFAGGIGAGSGGHAPSRPATARNTVLPAFGTDTGTRLRLQEAAGSSRDWQWDVGGELIDHADWRQRLADADVVVAHAGLGTMADLAAARRPAVIIPQPRPFGEQVATADLVRALDIGPVVLHEWPEPHEWDAVLRRASLTPTENWAAWGADDGARRAAAWLLEQL